MTTRDLQSWLGQVREEALEPELPICDPHHHLWDRRSSRYLLEDLWEDTGSGHRVLETVFVECMWGYDTTGPPALGPVRETELVREVAARSAEGGADRAVIAGIVGFADLSLGEEVAPVLEAHIEAAGGRFRGVRHSVAWAAGEEVPISHTRPPPGLMLDGRFRRGVACLERYDLVFEAWLYHPQIDELVELAQAAPGVTIVLDHVGGPLGVGSFAGRREEVARIWRTAMRRLAGCPNVRVKLGGLGMPRIGFDWHRRPVPPSSVELASDMAPYYRSCIELFGAERCMFESNFPVDKVSCSYVVLWNAFKRLTEDLSPAERQALFRGTAQRIYRLETAPAAAV